jgi:hypothetical protein
LKSVSTLALLIGVLLVVAVSAGGEALYAHSVSSAVTRASAANDRAAAASRRFQRVSCQLQAAQQANGRRFTKLISTLESRAKAREGLDREAGRFTLAAADADSVALYEAVLRPPPGPVPPPLPC